MKKESKKDNNCVFTGLPGHYRLGIIRHCKHKIVKDLGAVTSEKVLIGIDKIMKQAFGTNLWPVVMDLDGKILYRSDYADMDKISAMEGWRQYLKEQQKIKTINLKKTVIGVSFIFFAFTSCLEKYEKPFIIINKYQTCDKDIVNYTYQDKNGQIDTFQDIPSAYKIGDSIK